MGSSYRHGDHYNRLAHQQGRPARSAFKLEEIDARLHLLRPGQRVLDLGAAPGSWSQYAAQRIGSQGRLWALDLKPLAIALPAWAEFRQADVLALALADLPRPLDLVLSDMAPATSGDKFGDAARSHELARRVLEIAADSLRPGGAMVVKLFEGQDTPAFVNDTRRLFEAVRHMRPKATRSMSRELFVVATGRRED